MQLLTTKQVVVRITAIISVAEFLIMMVLGIFPDKLNAYIEAIVDVSMLVVLSTPLIYLWVIRPFVTARDEALAHINNLAHLDPLTGLANRRFILQHLEKTLAGNQRHKIYGALLVMDLDEFKHVNDSHGHDIGDDVLVEIARRIQTITRAEDVVARLGGDEFIVLLNHLDADEHIAHDKASQIAMKLIEQVHKPCILDGKELRVGVSIGIQLLGVEAMDTDTAINQADSAMYRAKQTGKGRVVFFGQ